MRGEFKNLTPNLQEVVEGFEAVTDVIRVFEKTS